MSYPAPVLATFQRATDFELVLDDEHRARMDDAYWAAFIRRPFSWQQFTTWWVARRWVIPRDVRKE